MKVLKRVNAELKFLYRQNKYLTPRDKTLLCNALNQPNFDNKWTSGFPFFNKNKKTQASGHKKQIQQYPLLSHRCNSS